jgi:hypothetical protein
MRPKNSKDKNKRKIKTLLNSIQERDLIADYENGIATKQLIKKYNVTKSCISSLFKKRNIKCRINHSFIRNWEKINNLAEMGGGISGVYAIYFIHQKNTNDIKLYIGSSIDIKTRLQDHVGRLNNGTHYSKNLNKHFKDHNYVVKYAIIERCCSDKIMQKESSYMGAWSRSCLLNSWLSVSDVELKPWLKEAINKDSYNKNYTINKNSGCKESLNVHKSGYAIMKVVYGGKIKYLYKHRIAYWEKYNEYPELVRHLCNNPKCYNADHLAKGTHRDNALDKRGDFPEIFESKWLEFNADPVKLSEYFADKWISNQKWKDTKISYSIYYWEKKLSLRKKYPEVLDSNKNRRFSINFQKKTKAH